MIEKGKISSAQLGKILYMAVIPTSLLTTPAITYTYAKQDLWISPIWAVCGCITVFVALKLRHMYPDDNIVKIWERIGGRIVGKVIGGLYFIYILYVTGVIVREYGDFVVGTFLRTTPLVFVSGSMVFVCVMAVRGGVEIIGRFADLFLPGFILLFLLNIVSIIPDLQMSNMFPIFGEGIRPSIEGAFVLQIWYSELIISSFFLPFVVDQHHAKRSILWSTLAIVFTLMISNLTTLFLLGELTGSYSYPFLILSRYINIGNFLNHLESIYMAIWVLGAFVKISIFFYVVVLVAGQWLELSNYRSITYPVGLIVMLFSMWVAPNAQELIHSLGTSVTFSTITMFAMIPGIGLVLVWIKRKLQHQT